MGIRPVASSGTTTGAEPVTAASAPPTAPVNDVRDLTALVGHHAEATILEITQGLHRAIAGRVFRYVPASTIVRWGHDAVSSAVYGSVRVGLRGLTAGAVLTATAAGAGREVRWLDSSPGHGRAAAILHGVIGDRFATDQPALDLPVTIRVDGRSTAPTTDALAAAFPRGTRRVAVFLHGLTEDEGCWDHPEGVVLPDVVADLGWTPVRLRYGTGRAIGRNGAELDELLEQLVDAWPTGVDELALVGHSMGGLVIRSAASTAVAQGRRWPALVAHTVSLGTPHLGSWLERAANAGTRLLRRLPEGEVIAQVIDTRARGIKDLRHGALSDACWGEGVLHEDGIGGLDGVVPAPADVAPLLDGAVHHLVAGRLTASPDHPVARVFGDALVTSRSALGDDGRRKLTGGQVETLELAAGHFRLMRDPAVGDHLRRWLA
jgi:pimeloyl-ACP methyl ester carboxylesterase